MSPRLKIAIFVAFVALLAYAFFAFDVPYRSVPADLGTQAAPSDASSSAALATTTGATTTASTTASTTVHINRSR